MRKGGGKSKGSSFERLVCKELSLWLTKGAQEDILWRSAMSGGRSTVAARKGKRLAAQAGDISSIHPYGHSLIAKYMVECKFYADLQYTGLLTNKGKLVEFWRVAKAEAERYGKLPMLIAKQNQQPITVCLCEKGIKAFGVKPILKAHRLGLHVVLFEDFVKRAVRP